MIKSIRENDRYVQLGSCRYDYVHDFFLQAVVSEQLAKHRELVTKARVVTSDSEAEEEEAVEEMAIIDPSKLGLGEEEDESYAEFSAKYKTFHKHQQEKVETAR